MQVDDYVKCFNLVPKHICDSLIEIHDKDEQWKQHTWYSPSDNKQESKHSKELDVLYNKNLKLSNIQELIYFRNNKTFLKQLVLFNKIINSQIKVTKNELIPCQVTYQGNDYSPITHRQVIETLGEYLYKNKVSFVFKASNIGLSK